MLITPEIKERFEKIREKGDVNKLTKLMGFSSHTCTSSVLNGRYTTTIGKIAVLVKFINKREKKLKELSEPDQN